MRHAAYRARYGWSGGLRGGVEPSQHRIPHPSIYHVLPGPDADPCELQIKVQQGRQGLHRDALAQLREAMEVHEEDCNLASEGHRGPRAILWGQISHRVGIQRRGKPPDLPTDSRPHNLHQILAGLRYLDRRMQVRCGPGEGLCCFPQIFSQAIQQRIEGLGTPYSFHLGSLGLPPQSIPQRSRRRPLLRKSVFVGGASAPNLLFLQPEPCLLNPVEVAAKAAPTKH